MKKYLFLAASALALASCSSDDIIGNGGGQKNETNAAINFNSGTNNITRATKTGEQAATDLNENFVVYGYKTAGEDASVVYDHYNVKWLGEATKGQTTSNTAGWEYVGQEKNALSSLPDGATQTIKYWDYSASQYDFVAFSFGQATQGTDVAATQVTTVDGPKYTLSGTVENLAKCFISDRVSAKKNLAEGDKVANKLVAYQDPVQFNFRSLATKVKMGIYETVPGYSIKDVKFYQNATETAPSATAPTLFAENATIPNGNGTMTITFGSNGKDATDFNQAKVSWAVDEAATNSKTVDFKELSTVDKEAQEIKGTKFIGRDAANASKPAEYKTVLPAEVGGLTLKVDYTLESIDGSGEEIKVTGATAKVPAEYTNWTPNYAYTYIFKISDKTNGGTGTGDDPKGLYPITFDAIVTVTEDGLQETITAVDEPSITTYAKGAIDNEYKTGANIYVSVTDKDLNLTGDQTNCALYTAEATGYALTEANVALALTKTADGDGNYKLTNGTNTLTVKPTTDLMSIVTEIAAADAVDGNKISGNFAKFKPTAAGTYVFEYTKTTTPAEGGTTETKKYYKVIVVKADNTISAD